MTNAADPSRVAAASRAERDAMKRHREDVRWVMGTVQGRRLMHGYLAQFGVFRTSYVPGAPDSATIFNEGQRNMALRIFADIDDACPEQYLRMMQESRADKPDEDDDDDR